MGQVAEARRKSWKPEVMLRWARIALAASSLFAFVLALVILVQFTTAAPPQSPQVTPQQAFYAGWYYGVPLVVGDWSLMGVWLGLLALAMPNPKRLIVICMIPLNLAYLYTSEAMWANDTLGNVTFRLEVYFSPTLTILDLQSLCLFAIIVGLAYAAYRKEGPLRASLRVLQVGSLAVLPLGLYIWLFLPSTLSMWVASIQERTAFQWFSNSDLLYLSLSLIVATTTLLAALNSRSTPPVK